LPLVCSRHWEVLYNRVSQSCPDSAKPWGWCDAVRLHMLACLGVSVACSA
jgi:hypothetical protein